jgi:AraC family transcriptional regulator of arabinose operon
MGTQTYMDARVATVLGKFQQSMGKEISISALAKTVNLTPARLRQLFRQETGRPPTQYFRELRMERSEELLRSTFLTVKEVASLSGVGDVSHFVRQFKKKHGATLVSIVLGIIYWEAKSVCGSPSWPTDYR